MHMYILQLKRKKHYKHLNSQVHYESRPLVCFILILNQNIGLILSFALTTTASSVGVY